MQEKKKFKDFLKENKARIIVAFIMLIISIVLTVLFLPLILSLKDETTRLNFKNYIESLGIWGYLIILGLQVLQIVIAIIPGEFIELLAGAMYGAWGGLVLCLIGVLIGTVMTYYITKYLGKPLLATKGEEKQISEYEFIKKEKKLELMFFILFFVPGTPKDLFNYIAPFTQIKFYKFLLIATLARIPSILTSTLIADSIIEGNYTLTIIVFAATIVLALLGVLFNKLYLSKKKEQINQPIQETKE